MTFQEPVYVRLGGGSKPNEGYVEIKKPGPGGDDWGGVCDDNVGKPEADVICRMLGYPHGSQKAWQGMAIPVVKFSRDGYKMRKVFGKKSTVVNEL